MCHDHRPPEQAILNRLQSFCLVLRTTHTSFSALKFAISESVHHGATARISPIPKYFFFNLSVTAGAQPHHEDERFTHKSQNSKWSRSKASSGLPAIHSLCIGGVVVGDVVIEDVLRVDAFLG